MTTPAEAENNPNIGSLLSASYHLMMGRILNDLAAAGHKDLTKTALHVLVRMGTEPTTADILWQRLQIPRQIIANLFGLLADNDYVTALDDSIEANSGRVVIAERGLEALKIVEAAQTNVETEWAANIGEDAYSKLREGLVALFPAALRQSTRP